MQITDNSWLIYPPEPLTQAIRGALLNALAFTDGNQDRAAKCLGLSPRVMLYQMRQHDIPTARVGRSPHERPMRAARNGARAWE